MATMPTRFIGLDIHKHYLVAIGVDQAKHQVFGPHRVTWPDFEDWIRKRLTPHDAVVVEMTTNTWQVHDTLLPHVHSVTVVHPPDVHLIVKAQVMNDKKAALVLAQLHAAGLLPAVWVPPQAVRDLRALIAQRRRLVSMATATKNRLHSVLHRHHLLPPAGADPFIPAKWSWWEKLPVDAVEQVRIQTDLATLEFVNRQREQIEACLAQLAAQDERMPLLVQMTGIGWLVALTVLAAVGDITRFPSAAQLVGYAGLGASVHDSGQARTTGRITKHGRRDLRGAMVEAAFHAVEHHPHWKAQYARLEPRLGCNRALVAIARKLLVVVWHVLTEAAADRFGKDEQIAASLFRYAYKVGVRNLPEGQSARSFTRQQLDRLGVGADLTEVQWGTKRPKLPPSALKRATGTEPELAG